MQFECAACDYVTPIKCNYDKHLLTSKHLKMQNNLKLQAMNKNFKCDICGKEYSHHQSLYRHKAQEHLNKPESCKHIAEKKDHDDNELKCTDCGKIFKHQPSLSRHKKMHSYYSQKNAALYTCPKCLCKFTTIELLYQHDKLNICEIDYTKLSQQEIIGIISQKFVNYNTHTASLVQTSNSSTFINGNNTLKNIQNNANFIVMNYPNAPALEAPPNYDGLITYVKDKDLMDEVVHNQHHESLHKYFGNFLVYTYKKEDPAEQSLWSTDVSRLKYYVKELMKNSESYWLTDHEGKRTKDKIIKPLLKFVDNEIIKYIDVQSKLFAKEKIASRREFINHKMKMALDAQTSIQNGTLADRMLQYITPYFGFDKALLLTT